MTVMKCTNAITAELLERWRAGEPGAAAELLFGTGLWNELLKNVRAWQLDAREDAILRVLGELERRDEEFTPERFLTVYALQSGRRQKDLLEKERQSIAMTATLDRSYASPDQDGEGDSRLDLLAASGSLQDPAYVAARELILEQLIALLQEFHSQLTRTFRRHLESVERALSELNEWAGTEERVILLLEFLHVGRRHQEGLAESVMELCCGENRRTYDSAHNWRLRRQWQGFTKADDSRRQLIRLASVWLVDLGE